MGRILDCVLSRLRSSLSRLTARWLKRRPSERAGIPTQTTSGEIHIPSAADRLPAVFQAIDASLDSLLAASAAASIDLSSSDRSGLVLFRIFERVVNTWKGVHLLLANDHWELAAPLTRAMFEMLLDVEEMRRGDDLEATAFRYAKHGLLQEVNHQIATLEDFLASGRRSDAASDRLGVLRGLRDSQFPEFEIRRRDGTKRWAWRWSGHSAKTLAERSDNPMRVRQYNALFSYLSSFSHGGASAVLSDLNALGGQLDVERSIRHNDSSIVEQASLGVSLLGEIWRLMAPPLPAIDIEFLGAVDLLRDEYLAISGSTPAAPR